MESKKFNAFFIILAACMQLTLVIFIICFMATRVQVVLLPVGEQRNYPRTIIADEYIESTRPVLYVNPVPTAEKLEMDSFLLSLILTDVSVKAKSPGIKYMNMSHHISEHGRNKHYLFIVF